MRINIKYNIPTVYNNYWPSSHGKHFVNLDNTKGDNMLFLAQDRIYLKDNVPFKFSGLFSNGHFFDSNKNSSLFTKIYINIYREDDFSNPLQSVELKINSNQFNSYELEIPAISEEGWCTFAICIPPRVRVAADFLSLSSADDMKGWKKDAVSIIKNKICPKTMRFPGGCFASLYDWRDGVGPREMRPFSYDTWWECELLNDVGVVEFVELCEEIGAKPFYCVPMMFNDVNNACELVDFCNNPTNARRISYGRSKPLNIKLWEFENEPYRKFDAITYAEKCKEYAIRMKQVDPTIKVAAGNYWVYHQKFNEMLEIYGPYVDLINNRGGDINEIESDIKIVEAYNKAHGTSIKVCHTEFRAPLIRSKTKIDGLNQIVNDSDETLFNRSVKWEYAMNMAEQYLSFQKLGGTFYTANFTNLTDGWGESLLNNAKEGSYLSAAGVAFSLLSSLDVYFPQAYDVKNIDNNIIFFPALNQKRDKLTIVLLNFNNTDRKVSVNIKDVFPKHKSIMKKSEIAPKSLDVFNTQEERNNISLAKSIVKAKGNIKLTIRPNSLIVLEVTR